MEQVDTVQPIPDWRTRSHRRFELEFPVRLKFQTGAGSTEIDGVSKNVSIGGLLVRSVSPIPPHTPVSFELSLHGKRALRPVRVVGEGEVVRTEPGEHEASFAVAVKCNSPVVQLEDYLPV